MNKGLRNNQGSKILFDEAGTLVLDPASAFPPLKNNTLYLRPASKAMNKIRETVEMISGFGEEENTEYLPIKLKNPAEIDQNNNPIQKV